MPGWLWVVFIGIGVWAVVQTSRETRGKARGGIDSQSWYGGSDGGAVQPHHHHGASDESDSDGDGGDGDGEDGGGGDGGD